jgi:hypothetical protein
MANPLITDLAKWSFVYLNGRFQKNDQQSWTIPQGRIFVLTDLVAQNKGPGDVPVADTDFTRFAITAPLGIDTFFHVVGNETLNLHFRTGLPISDSFRFLNMANSTATLVEFHITGRLRSAD